MRPGDGCRIMRNKAGKPRVVHVDCAGYRRGEITDPVTGEVTGETEKDMA